MTWSGGLSSRMLASLSVVVEGPTRADEVALGVSHARCGRLSAMHDHSVGDTLREAWTSKEGLQHKTSVSMVLSAQD